MAIQIFPILQSQIQAGHQSEIQFTVNDSINRHPQVGFGTNIPGASALPPVVIATVPFFTGSSDTWSVTVTVPISVNPDTYTVTITAVGGGLDKQTSTQLIQVTADAPAPPPPPGSTSVDLGPLIAELKADLGALHNDLAGANGVVAKFTAGLLSLSADITNDFVNYLVPAIDGIDVSGPVDVTPALAAIDADLKLLTTGLVGSVSPVLTKLGAFLEAAAKADAPGPVPDISGSIFSLDKFNAFLRANPAHPGANLALLAQGVQTAHFGTIADFLENIEDSYIIPFIEQVVTKVAELVAKGMTEISKLESPIAGVIAAQQATFLLDFKKAVLDPGVSTPEDAIKRASVAYGVATEFGMKAHMFSVLTELIHPTKHMGMSNLAASVADLADYGGLARAVIGSQIQETVGEPMRQASNAIARSRIPSERELEIWVQKRDLSLEDYAGVLQFFGWPEKFIKAARDAVFREPTMRDLALTLQDSQTDSAFLFDKVQRAGYSDDDADFISDALVLKTLTTHRTALLSSAILSYKNGVTGIDDLEAVMNVLDLRDEAKALIRQRAAIDVRYDYVTEAQGVYEKAATNDQITVDDLRVGLTGLGIQPDRVDLAVQKVQATRLPRIAAKEAAIAAAAIRQAQTLLLGRYKTLFLDGAITAGAYQDDLVAIGIDPQLAQTIVHLDELRFLANASKVGSAAADVALRQAVKLQETNLVDLFRRQAITQDQLKTSLLGLGIPTTIVDATVQIEATKRIPIRSVVINPPAEAKAAALAEKARTLAVLEFRKGLINGAGLKSALIATGEDPDLVLEDVAIETARATARAGPSSTPGP